MRQTKETVYLAFGGNLSNSLETLKQAIAKIAEAPGFSDLEASSIYRTKAVSPIPQADYYNAVCRVDCQLSPGELLRFLEELEQDLGQQRKAKNAPRLIDIDIIFYGQTRLNEAFLEIPHPRWRERLFVLKPLSDLLETVEAPLPGGGSERLHLPSYLERFPGGEEVELLEKAQLAISLC